MGPMVWISIAFTHTHIDFYNLENAILVFIFFGKILDLLLQTPCLHYWYDVMEDLAKYKLASLLDILVGELWALLYIWVCMYGWMYACMYVCKYVCIHVCTCIYTYFCK